MKCEDLHPSAVAAAGRTPEIESHLAECAECRENIEMWARLGTLEDEQPGAALRTRVMDMITAYRAGMEQAEAPPRTSAKRSVLAWFEGMWPARPAFQFLLALVCAGVALAGGYGLAARHGSNGELARLRQEVRKTQELVAISLLRQDSATDRLRGVTYSCGVPAPDDEVLSALLHTVKYDRSVDVRLAAVDALKRFTARPPVRDGIIDALRAPQSPLVHIALIDLVVETRLSQASDALKTLKENDKLNAFVRERAGWGLQQF
ncbi:MAG TPA: hypothetical protein VN428_05855 [Bryobacteraceae bacterium]|nr:hypothetical protein [Bryobacteraceae bacterium]